MIIYHPTVGYYVEIYIDQTACTKDSKKWVGQRFIGSINKEFFVLCENILSKYTSYFLVARINPYRESNI